ncbi:thermonuclease family protein [Mesorhizobium sp. B3-2-1]|nr:thermonuclease family protein [Mesorhizobium sp. B3-2-1]
MRTRTTCLAWLLATSVAFPSPCWPADAVRLEMAPQAINETVSKMIVGRVALIDGRTLWFPRSAQKVRLAGIDACELPQWSFDPTRYGKSTLKPVPCGPLARAWLKRIVGDSRVTCTVIAVDSNGAYVGSCSARGHDLAVEMLRVGWARVNSPSPPGYISWQRYAMVARHGMWATYVLDMDEWRAGAVDRTLQRQPIADFNLLAERKREISPPFIDARKRPAGTDR